MTFKIKEVEPPHCADEDEDDDEAAKVFNQNKSSATAPKNIEKLINKK